MNIVIIGGRELGCYLAESLSSRGHKVTIIEAIPRVLERITDETIVKRIGNLSDPGLMRDMGISQADLLLILTDSDKLNLILSLQARLEFSNLRTVVLLNNGKNEWLFAKEAGVDQLIRKDQVIEEEVLRKLKARLKKKLVRV